MAKKKVTNHSEKKATKSQEKEAPSTTAAMEETGKKMESLKSLNAMLLKETVELRKQVSQVSELRDSISEIVKSSNVQKEQIKKLAAEVKHYRDALENKEDKMEEMKRQVEFLQNSVAEAHKKKRFWTIVSSATTLFAAISVAYLAQRH